MVHSDQTPDQSTRNQQAKSSQQRSQSDNKSAADENEFTGSAEDSYKAATSGVSQLTPQDHTHPTKIYHAREETGRHADDKK